MTSATLILLGHTLGLTASGDALTRCKWTHGNAPSPESSEKDEDESGIIREAERQLQEYAEGKRRRFDVPVRPEGSEFQMKVWDQLRRIPYGETVTYGELARRVGNPRAFRAVANACGANPLPIIIPCHRVVAAGGKPGGYTGGLAIKLALLEIEKQNRRQ